MDGGEQGEMPHAGNILCKCGSGPQSQHPSNKEPPEETPEPVGGNTKVRLSPSHVHHHTAGGRHPSMEAARCPEQCSGSLLRGQAWPAAPSPSWTPREKTGELPQPHAGTQSPRVTLQTWGLRRRTLCGCGPWA